MKPTPHKHAALIKLWADGAVIEKKYSDGSWKMVNVPMWQDVVEYRVQPRVFPKSSLSYDALCNLVNDARDQHKLMGSNEGHDTFIARMACDAAVKQYILDTEKK